MRILAKSDIGRAREMNQDSYYVSDLNKDEIKLYILADGMGGYKGGEIASSLAVTSTKNYITTNFKKCKKDRESILSLLRNAIEYANTVVHEKAKEKADLHDMGTTLDVCLIYNNKVFIGHVGDSRVYRIRKNIIRKLTTDHSYVEKLLKEGTITKEEAYNHPKKNMLMKALGCNDFVEPDVICKGFLKDDILLMCSDGLTNMLRDNEIYSLLLNNPEKPEDALIKNANELGGYDNITLIIVDNIEVGEEETKER
ncbi:MAG: Stp1/IreP family PP2C-type Ser/Thr phosphatase [Clostridia bacterium]|nr:Stp1/IreP family PP2C-type Ser/Thr phosphatase [Clostridia bacterium]